MGTMDQNTAAWHEWRNAGMGSSDAPIIMSKSPYGTPLSLWELKTGLKKAENKSSPVMDLGHRFEPIARAQYALETGVDLEPDCFEHKEFPFMRASLDGYNKELNIFCEIKYTGKDNLAKVKETKAPLPHHFDQLMHQFAVTGATKCIYIVYTLNTKKSDISELFYCDVLPDENYILNKLIPTELAFWKCVQDKTPPELTDDDVVEDLDIISITTAHLWRLLNKSIKALEDRKAEVEEQLLERVGETVRYKTNDLYITRSNRIGSVDYKKVPELKDVDLEKYRKPGSSYFSFKDKKVSE